MANELEIQVPKFFGRPMSLLGALSAEQFADLVAALSTLPPGSSRTTAIDAMTASGLAAEDAAVLLDFVTQTRALVTRTAMDVRAVSKAVVRALGTDEQLDQADRLADLLSSAFIEIREKVIDLMRVPEPRLDGSRCFTDFRPVFGVEGATDKVLGFVVVNSLILELDGDHQDRTVTINVGLEQLSKLREVIERAMNKHETLAETLATAGLVNLTQREQK